MVWKLILLIFFGVLDTSFFEKLGQQWPEVFCCDLLCAKGTHYVSQDVLSIILDGLDEKINPKKTQWAQLACGESPPIEQLEAWCIGFNHLLINASRGNLRSTLLAVATARGLGWPKNGKWFEVGSWYSKTRVGYEWIRGSPILNVYTSHRRTMDVHVKSERIIKILYTCIFDIYVVYIAPSFLCRWVQQFISFKSPSVWSNWSTFFDAGEHSKRTHDWQDIPQNYDRWGLWSFLIGTSTIVRLVSIEQNLIHSFVGKNVLKCIHSTSCCLSVLTLILGGSHNTNLYNNFEFLS